MMNDPVSRRLALLGLLAFGVASRPRTATALECEPYRITDGRDDGWAFEGGWDEEGGLSWKASAALRFLAADGTWFDDGTVEISRPYGSTIHIAIACPQSRAIVPPHEVTITANGRETRLRFEAEAGRYEARTDETFTDALTGTQLAPVQVEIGGRKVASTAVLLRDLWGAVASAESEMMFRCDSASDWVDDGEVGPDDCFLTTATCSRLGLADDCFELAMLRRFRDEVMMRTAEGRAEVAAYYALAPRVMARLAPGWTRWRWIGLYLGTILPCALMIRFGAGGLARRRYWRLVRRIEAELA